MFGQVLCFYCVFLKLSNTKPTPIIFLKEKLFMRDEGVFETGKAKENNETLACKFTQERKYCHVALQSMK